MEGFLLRNRVEWDRLRHAFADIYGVPVTWFSLLAPATTLVAITDKLKATTVKLTRYPAPCSAAQL
jgi:hypothetical protein